MRYAALLCLLTAAAVAQPFDLRVEGYPYEGKLQVTANIAGLGQPPAGLTVRAQLKQGERVLATCALATFDRGVGRAAFDLGELPPGTYQVAAEAVAGDRVLGSATAEYEQFAHPAWWHSTAGVDHSVPRPWQPVQATDQGLALLGRQYDGRGLPHQIVNQGQPMLAGPTALTVSAGGQTADLATLAMQGGDDQPDVSIATGETTVGPLRAQLRASTEFDGMQRFDLTLTPSGPAELSSLTLEVPLQKRLAAFLLSSNGHASTPVELRGQPWHAGFIPLVWVGNDDQGLAWFAERDQHWKPRDDTAIELVPAADRAVLRVRMVRAPLAVTGPITYTFGLMATPVKDGNEGDPFWFRFGSPLGDLQHLDDPTHSDQPREFLRYPAAGNLDPRAGTLEFRFKPVLPGPRQVVTCSSPDSALTLTYRDDPPSLSLELSGKSGAGRVRAAELPLSPDAFTPLALSWSDHLELHVNGREVTRLSQRMPANVDTIRFGCGSEWSGTTGIAIDEVRLSRGDRYPGEYTPSDEPFTADADTLLLDHLDDSFTPDGEDAETHAALTSAPGGVLGGVPTLGCRFVPGQFGNALQLTDPEPLSSVDSFRLWGPNAWLYWDWFEPDPPRSYGWPPPLMVRPVRGDESAFLRRLDSLGVRPSAYLAYSGIGAPSMLARQFGAEWSRRPLSTQPFEPPEGHYFLDCCGNSGWADYLAAGTQYAVEQLGFTGAYTDGNVHCYPCNNTHHGCGYVDEQGVLRTTVPIFATREYLKRMYRIVHAHSRGGYLINYASSDTFIPTLSFSDVYYSGEHEPYEDPLTFRTRWSSNPWGVWTTLYGPDAQSYGPLETTWSLLHGVSVMPQGVVGRNDLYRKTVHLWQTYDAFGYRQATWLPYYRAAALARPDRDTVKVSLYRHPAGRALLVIGNLAHEVATPTVALDLRELGLKGQSARNALTDERLDLRANLLRVRVRPTSFVLAWVE